MRALLERGVQPGRLSAVGYGETKPIADNKKPAGRAQNRRVEFMIEAQQ
jgi:OOP family OmpA-OmpF porin